MRPLAAAISAGLCLLASFSPAGENGGAARAGAGPLAGLPSKPGPHVAKIKALGNGRWLDLGSPAPDPRWGKALGRSYSTRMVFLPGKRASFLAGQGVHAGMKKNGVYQDEIFAYDINAHRWICLYPGSDVNNLTLKLDAHGFEVDGKGEHVPVAILGHGHHLMTSDSHLGKVVIVPLGNTWWTKAFPRRKKWLDERAASWLRNPRHPWFYDVKTGRWGRRKVEGEGPEAEYCYSLVSLPGRNANLLYRRGAAFWLYSGDSNAWKQLKPDGPSPDAPDYDGVSCLDTRRERLYVFNRNGKKPGIFMIYDIAGNAWIDPAPAVRPDVVAGSGYSCTRATAHYDSVSDVVVLRLRGRNASKPGIYVYDPGKNQWTPEPLTSGTGGAHSFYDPGLNAHFFFDAGDRKLDPGVIRAWRYRRVSK